MGFLDVFNWRDVASVSCCSDFAGQPLQEDEPTKDERPLELDRSNLVGGQTPVLEKPWGTELVGKRQARFTGGGRLGGRSGRTRIDASAV